jgi:hypothetical protein
MDYIVYYNAWCKKLKKKKGLRYLLAIQGFEYDVCIINLEETPKKEHW